MRILSGRVVFWLIWSAIALTFGIQWLSYRSQIGAPDWVILLFAAVYTFLWTGLSLPLKVLVRRRIHPLVYLPAGLATVVIHLSLYYSFYRLFRIFSGIDYYRMTWWAFLKGYSFFALILFGLLLSALYLIDLSGQLRERRERAEALEKELISVQLQSLKQQLQPHFLFNTLNSLMVLIDEDSRVAKRMVIRLAEFLRATIDLPQEGMIPLRQELHLADLYLQIEAVRFSDRLRVCLPSVDGLPDIAVPALIVQPLLENAIKHGIAPFARPGDIVLELETTDRNLILQVNNSGVSSGPNADRPGLGLSNVRNRLAHVYGDRACLTAGPREAGGYCARIVLPLPGDHPGERT